MSAKWQSTEKTTCTKWSSSGLERLVLFTGSPQQDANYSLFFYLHPEITSERRSSQQGLSSLAQRKKTREPVSISGSITDALKAFCSNSISVSEACVLLWHSTAWIHAQRHQALHLLPSKKNSQRHCPTLAAPLVCPKEPQEIWHTWHQLLKTLFSVIQQWS